MRKLSHPRSSWRAYTGQSKRQVRRLARRDRMDQLLLKVSMIFDSLGAR